MDDESYMRLALEEAEIGLSEGNWPIGCVIELKGSVIAKTHNQVYTLKDRLAHAEMLALRQVQNELQYNRKKLLFTQPMNLV